jgi:hypothetical protein
MFGTAYQRSNRRAFCVQRPDDGPSRFASCARDKNHGRITLKLESI